MCSLNGHETQINHCILLKYTVDARFDVNYANKFILFKVNADYSNSISNFWENVLNL